jgi:uncharacterized PurR-regulated membrane protein YhhQ (DUF165 family)
MKGAKIRLIITILFGYLTFHSLGYIYKNDLMLYPYALFGAIIIWAIFLIKYIIPKLF